MISTVHTFTVWHPRYDGTPPKYTESEFGFNQPVTRQQARDIITRVEGYVIYVKPRPRTGIQQKRVKHKQAKIR